MSRPTLTFTKSTTVILLLFIIASIVAVMSLSSKTRIVHVKEYLDTAQQSVIFETNNKILSVEDVVIMPEIPHHVVEHDFGFGVYFDEILLHNTSYKLQFSIRDAADNIIAHSHTLSVDDAPIYYLSRDETSDDIVYKTVIGDENATELFRAQTILTYEVTASFLYVLAAEETNEVLHVVHLSSQKTTASFVVPDDTIIRSLSGNSRSDTLLINSLKDTTRPHLLIVDSDFFTNNSWDEEKAIKVLEAGNGEMLRDGKSYIYFENYTTLVLDTIEGDKEPILVGKTDDFLDVSTGFNTLLVRRNDSLEQISPNTDPVALPTVIPSFAGYIQFLKDESQYLYIDYQAGIQKITIYEEGGIREIAAINRSTNIAQHISQSDDSQYISLQVMPSDSLIRTDLRINNYSDETVTRIYRQQDGELVRTLPGIQVIMR